MCTSAKGRAVRLCMLTIRSHGEEQSHISPFHIASPIADALRSHPALAGTVL